MRTLYMLVLLNLLTLYVRAQQVSKILKIDTVDGVTQAFNISVREPDSFGNEYLDAPKINLLQHNSFIGRITAKDQEGILLLALDDSGGYASIKNAFVSNTDTIHINKWHVYHNCLPDSVHSSYAWYKKYPSDTGSKLELLRSREWNTERLNNCGKHYPPTISFIINNIGYETLLKKCTRAGEVSFYCGGHKKMSERRTKKYEKAKEDGKPYKYFAASVATYNYVLSAEIDLLNIGGH